MKVAIIAIAKNENLYINEWVDYHLNMGFDSIIIGDNDDTLVLKDVVNDDRVIIKDYTKQTNIQQMAYKNMFAKYKDEYDWLFFIDIDEFLVLETYKNVKDFLSSYGDDVQCINLCWKLFGDDEQLDVVDGNYKVFGRFNTVVTSDINKELRGGDKLIKSFIKNTIPDEAIKYISQHSVNYYRINSIDVLGNRHYGRYIHGEPIYKVAWINHYPTKTIGEYIRQKYFRGGPNNNSVKYRNLRHFFRFNTKTDEKVAYAEKLIKEYDPNKV